MNINYKLIEAELNKLDKKLARQAGADNTGKKFSLLMLKKLSGYRGQKLSSFFCDGSGDHQIDAVYFYEGKDEIVFNLITCIFKSNPNSTFEDKDVTDFINHGVKYLMFGGDEPCDINGKIKLLKEEIDEQKGIYENNFSVNLKFVTSTDKALTANSKNQLIKFQNEMTSSGSDLSIEEINGQNVAALFSSRKLLKVSIPIKLSGKSYYLLTGKEGFVCRLPVAEIIKFYFGFTENGREYNGYGDFLFTDNVRKDLGVDRKINQKIYESATNPDTASDFEYYNNGLTIIYDEITGPIFGDSPTVSLKGLQIVNGCQTVNTLLKAHKDKKLQEDLYITCRFIKRTSDDKFIQSVITYTNSQNAITERDLHSNDDIQYSIQTILKNYDILYERKLNEYKDQDIGIKLKVDALDLAQAYLCCELKKPHRAKQEKRNIFGKLYTDIFDRNRQDLAHRLFLSNFILEAVMKRQAENRNKKRETEKAGKAPRYSVSDQVISHGSYHIAAKIYQKYFGTNVVCTILEKAIKSKKLPNDFDADYKMVLGEITSFIEGENIKREDFAKYFKANALMT